MNAVKLKVHGVVQGVSFRSFAKREAEKLSLKGYVKNMHDGTVEVVAEGNKQRLELFVETLHSGPERAQVHKVDVEWTDCKGFKDFQIIY